MEKENLSTKVHTSIKASSVTAVTTRSRSKSEGQKDVNVNKNLSNFDTNENFLSAKKLKSRDEFLESYDKNFYRPRKDIFEDMKSKIEKNLENPEDRARKAHENFHLTASEIQKFLKIDKEIVEKVTSGCEICAKYKSYAAHPRWPTGFMKMTEPYFEVSMDVIFLRDYHPNTILLAVDTYSKMFYFSGLHSQDSATVLDCLYVMFKDVPWPKIIRSNQNLSLYNNHVKGALLDRGCVLKPNVAFYSNANYVEQSVLLFKNSFRKIFKSHYHWQFHKDKIWQLSNLLNRIKIQKYKSTRTSGEVYDQLSTAINCLSGHNDIEFNLIGRETVNEKPFNAADYKRFIHNSNCYLKNARTNKKEDIEESSDQLLKTGDHVFFRSKGDKDTERIEGMIVSTDMPEVSILTPSGYIVTRHIKHVVKI